MEAAAVDLYLSRVYLSLNLYPEALDLARSARAVFAQQDMARYVALADFNHDGLLDVLEIFSNNLGGVQVYLQK